MSKKNAGWASLLDFTVDKSDEKPIYWQIYTIICNAILERRIESGAPLPSTRSLADQLGVSRTSVVDAFEILAAEGYVETRHGSGTYVAQLSELNLVSAERPTIGAQDTAGRKGDSGRLQRLADIGRSANENALMTVPFASGLCTLDARTRDAWRRTSSKYSGSLGDTHRGYSSPLGSLRLREQIANYLRVSRGVSCEASQILVVSGTQQAMDIVIRTLLSTESKVWVEDPAYPSSKAALTAHGVTCVPVPIDGHGMIIKAGKALAPEADCAFVTPSHQFATGAIMSVPRRLELLAWAEKTGAWIVEDDYDSEYRFAGRPITALQGLDSRGSVIYIGTFSKVLLPGLRMGYLVAPPALVDAFCGCRALLDRHPPSSQQDILADFLAEGHFLSHIRRTRAYYQEALNAIVSVLQEELKGCLEIQKPDAGMQLSIALPDGVSDVALCAKLREHGIASRALSPMFEETANRRSAVLLGYSGFSIQELRKAARTTGKVIREKLQGDRSAQGR
ncbi:PLP-dependent aminotransferase family protein [Salipiger sp. H15]|uniref:PLP-dependent aminotransferase family protein n=1 Tax=Alloyangia sp. H15 TaxID=3029062 RepID=A0AAU8AKV3_9RHOB